MASDLLPAVGRADGDERLQALLTLTDTTLNRLGLEDLMTEVLERIRIILDVDTVTMLRMNADGDRLVADAAVGLEEEVRQGVTVPVGQGFAGMIAATRKAAVIESVTAETVFNPLLWERGLRTMLGVPMLRDERIIGVLHVGRTTLRAFTDVDSQLLAVAAERVAGALTANQLIAESTAARQLELSLLPGRFPQIAGAEFAGRYAAAERRIGGDWYDVFALPDGELWMVVGDVAGHGLRSAVVMGRVRSALRAYAMLGGGPAHVLELTDRKIHHFNMDAMTTVLCAVSQPPYQTFSICSAGHPPPVLAAPGSDARVVDVVSDIPLGSIPGVKRTEVTLELPVDSVLTLYTDGLVERPGEPIDDGIDRLCRAVVADSPELVCRSVMRHMVADTFPRDDIALLTMRRVCSN